VRTLGAYSLSFPASAAGELWRAATSRIASWYAGNVGVTLADGWERGVAELLRPAPEHVIECHVTGLDGRTEGLLHELSWQFPDADDPSLRWTVDIAMLPTADATLFTLVSRIASVDFELLPARVRLHTPRIICDVVGRGDSRIGLHPISSEPAWLDPEQVPELVQLLCEQSRRHPIVVASPDPATDAPAVDPVVLSDALAGLASVHVLASRWSGYALTDEIGKDYSCYNGAVRIYWPRFEPGVNRFEHPLWLPPHIDQLGGESGFAPFLHRMIAGAASFRFVEPAPLRAFRARIEEARAATLRASVANGYESLFDEYVKLDVQARELRARVETLSAENESLRRDVSARWAATADANGSGRSNLSDERPEPANVLQAVEHAAERLAHVKLLPSAFESARESPFRQPLKVYSALAAIDDVARSWIEQLGGGPGIGSRHDAFRQRGFEYKDDISQIATGRWRDEYTYLYEGKRILFAPHITIGAKSADRCLSIHMYWDEGRRRVAVAHVGRHKTNTLS
jgi:hypothetical protein